jgi:RNA polymerase sigma factor (sigma-70 family)
MTKPASIAIPNSSPLPRRLLSDRRLTGRAIAGDAEAFEEIFHRHEAELYRYCRGILAHHEDAQDALQATMASALRSLPGESRDIALKPWLYRVAHNESISILRRRRTSAADVAELELAPGADIEAETRERLRTLVTDLDSLPDRQRGALTMRELSGMSYEEVGAALVISPAAARQAVYEARTALVELGEAREMECEQAQRAISARDGRILRGRKLRAHIRSCDGCRGFEASIAQRSKDFRLLSPVLPGAAGAGILAGLLGGEASRTLATSGAAKAIAALSAAAVVGAGAAGIGGAIHLPGLGSDHPPPHAQHSPASPSAPPAAHSGDDGRDGVTAGAPSATDPKRSAPAERHSHPHSQGGRGSDQRGPVAEPAATNTNGNDNPSAGAASAAQGSNSAAASSGHVSNAGGAGDQTPAGSDPDLPPTSNGKPPAGSNAGGSGSPVAGANSNAGGNSAAHSQASSAPGQAHSQAAEHSNSSVHGN